MVFTHCTLQNSYILCITNLDDQFPTSFLDLTFKNLVTVFRHPDNMNRQPRDRMIASSLVCHSVFALDYHRLGSSANYARNE